MSYDFRPILVDRVVMGATFKASGIKLIATWNKFAREWNVSSSIGKYETLQWLKDSALEDQMLQLATKILENAPLY